MAKGLFIGDVHAKARARSRAWRLANPEKVRAHQAAWRATHVRTDRATPAARVRAEELRLMSVYGMSRSDRDGMLAKQGGGCAICGLKETVRARGKTLHVDHDHVTGKVRGLLCVSCNTTLGRLENNDFMTKARAYLERG